MNKLARWGTLVGGVMIFAAALLVCLELVLRNLFTISLAGADEISSYLSAVSVALALPFVILSNGNIRIEALVRWIPGSVRHWVLRLGTAALAVFLGLLAWRAVQMAYFSFTTGARSVTPLQTPIAIPQSLWALGLVVATVVCVVQIFRPHRISDEIGVVAKAAHEWTGGGRSEHGEQ